MALLEAAAQAGIGNHREGAAEAGDVVGFGRRHQRDAAFGGLRRQAGEGNVALVGVENQAAMDFVGADDQVVFFGEAREIEQFIAAPAAANRVVRVAEQEKPGCCGQRRFEGNFVPVPVAIALQASSAAVEPAAGKMRRRKEGRIDRRRRQHLAIDCPAGHVEPVTSPAARRSTPARSTSCIRFKVSEH
jgi:hypothetical protein